MEVEYMSLINIYPVQSKKRLATSYNKKSKGPVMKRRREEESSIKTTKKCNIITLKPMNQQNSPFLQTIRKEPSLLYHICYDLRNDMTSLVQFYRYLVKLSLHLLWLRQILEGSRFNELWFIVFKYLYPKEIIYAYEYDYIIHHPSTIEMSKISKYSVAYQIESILNNQILCHYNGKDGIIDKSERGIDGKTFYQNCYMAASIEMMMIGDDRKENALTKINNMNANDITVYHIKMRRIILLCIKKMSSICSNYCKKEYGTECCVDTTDNRWVLPQEWIHFGSIINMCQTCISFIISQWDSEKIYQSIDIITLFKETINFFTEISEFNLIQKNYPRLPLSSISYWHEMIHQIILQVDDEIPYPNETIFINHFHDDNDAFFLIENPKKYDFIYHSTSKSRTNFEHRLLYRESSIIHVKI